MQILNAIDLASPCGSKNCLAAGWKLLAHGGHEAMNSIQAHVRIPSSKHLHFIQKFVADTNAQKSCRTH